MSGDPNMQKDVTMFTKNAKKIGEAFKISVSGYTES
jgi:hypothetical protein